jgi:hypothetical protein
VLRSDSNALWRWPTPTQHNYQTFDYQPKTYRTVLSCVLLLSAAYTNSHKPSCALRYRAAYRSSYPSCTPAQSWITKYYSLSRG